jgi:hypothetical protein
MVEKRSPPSVDRRIPIGPTRRTRLASRATIASGNRPPFKSL